MINNLKSDFLRIAISKKYIALIMFISVVLPVGSEIILNALYKIMNIKPICSLNDYMTFQTEEVLYLALLITYYLHFEMEEGILRNKIISGKKRENIYLSYCIMLSSIAVLMLLLSVCSTGLTVIFLGYEFEADLIMKLFKMLGLQILSSIAVCFIMVTVYFICGTSKAAIVIPGCIAIASRIGLLVVFDKLYPENGVCLLTGVKLWVFKFIEQYVPFSFLAVAPRISIIKGACGCVLFICLSAFVGVVAIKNVDLK